jgi:hypothetical protein
MKDRGGVRTVISGGQTGADQGGLIAARSLGVATGGTAPRDWLTEDGPQRALLLSFGLKECSDRGYPARTKANVLKSDGTLIVGPYRTGGSALTAKIANDHRKPLFTVPYGGTADTPTDDQVEEFRFWLGRHRIRVLNVAGNRESQSPGIGRFTSNFLIAALGPENASARSGVL